MPDSAVKVTAASPLGGAAGAGAAEAGAAPTARTRARVSAAAVRIPENLGG